MDPRVAGMANPLNRRDGRSKFFKLQSSLMPGNVVNACPFGCGDDQLDEKGFCYHMVGFCNSDRDGKPLREYEPLCRMRMQSPNQPGKIVDRGNTLMVLGGKEHRQPLQKGDVLVRITNSFRVYRKSMTPEMSVVTPVATDREEDWIKGDDEIEVREGPGGEEAEEAGEETPISTRAVR